MCSYKKLPFSANLTIGSFFVPISVNTGRMLGLTFCAVFWDKGIDRFAVDLGWEAILGVEKTILVRFSMVASIWTFFRNKNCNNGRIHRRTRSFVSLDNAVEEAVVILERETVLGVEKAIKHEFLWETTIVLTSGLLPGSPLGAVSWSI